MVGQEKDGARLNEKGGFQEILTMRIFKVEPIESKLDDPRWTRSTHKKWVVVRAENEDQAITIVSRNFDIATGRQLGTDVLIPPWWDKNLVEWTEINDPKYPAEGQARILEKG